MNLNQDFIPIWPNRLLLIDISAEQAEIQFAIWRVYFLSLFWVKSDLKMCWHCFFGKVSVNVVPFSKRNKKVAFFKQTWIPKAIGRLFFYFDKFVHITFA